MGKRVVIEHPQEPGRPTTIAAHHYDPERHRLWVEETSGGYRVEHNAPWYTIVGPDGEKVGKATMDEQEAHERLRELDE